MGLCWLRSRFRCGGRVCVPGVRPAGMMTGVTAPDDDLAVLAGVQGVLIEILETRNCDLEARNSELTAQVADLAERLARLERAVSRNSGNSGMPPSADDLPGKTPPAPKPGRGSGKRRQGKQPGAPGAHLAWSDHPDDTKPLFPQGACACGRDLADADDLGVVASHQLMDTPVVTAALTQYDEHAVACRCGRAHAAPPPAGAGEAGTVTYGPNLQAWVVFLLVAHHVPVERCAGIIEALTGTRPSDGFVHSMIARAARAVRWANMLIRALVITASVLCADETPIRVGPGPKTRKKYLLVACTSLMTCFFLGDRSMKTFDAFVFPDLSAAVLVPDGDIAADLVLFRNAVRVGLSQVRPVTGPKAKQKPGRSLLECLRDREADVLRFLGDLRIPPTSNQAERDLRPSKTQQKISGRLRSETATRNRYAIRGYLDTARKHGTDIMTAIRDALTGNPWMPPLPT